MFCVNVVDVPKFAQLCTAVRTFWLCINVPKQTFNFTFYVKVVPIAS